MSTMSLWLFTVVLGGAVGIGALSFGMLVLAGLIPVFVLIGRSRSVLAGLGGLGTGFGAAWTASLFGAGAACGGNRCSPETFVIAAIAIFAIGLATSTVAAWKASARRPALA
jgi:hypothetical protein